MPRSEPAWSHSKIKVFDQCPKKYNHQYNLKDIPYEESESMKYGNELHKACEHFIGDGLPLDPRFAFMQDILDKLNGIKGIKKCEQKLGVAKIDEFEYEPCTYFAKNIWLRTIADLLIIDGTTAYVIDYKTGKNAKYADTTQLDLIAGSVFVHYPEVETIRSALAYVISGDFIQKVHTRDKMHDYLRTYRPQLHRLVGALESGIWNAVDGPLCGWCPVTSCEHWYKPKNRG